MNQAEFSIRIKTVIDCVRSTYFSHRKKKINPNVTRDCKFVQSILEFKLVRLFFASHQQHEWKRICFGSKSNVILSFHSATSAAAAASVVLCINLWFMLVLLLFVAHLEIYIVFILAVILQKNAIYIVESCHTSTRKKKAEVKT